MSTFRQKVQANTDWGKPDPVEEAPPRGRWKAKRKAADTPHKRADQQPRRAAPAPVTSHRLFPAFAALWFAALLGLGSLAISSEVLGKLVVAMGLPALVPAAAPPLGFTAHILVALALTGVGAALGLVLGMRLRPHTAPAAATAKAEARPAPVVAEPDETAAPKVRARDAHPDAPPRRPLVLTEAFANPAESQIDQPHTEQLAAPAEPLLRRKPSESQSAPPASIPETWIREYTPGGLGAMEPLDLAALDLAEIEVGLESGLESEMMPELVNLPEPPAFSASDFVLAPEAGFAASSESPEAESRPEAALEAATVSDDMPGETSNDLAEEFAPTAAPYAFSSETNDEWNDGRNDGPRDDVAAKPVWPTLLAATPQVPSGFTLPQPHPDQLAAGETWSPVAGAPLASLGLVQLIERLALAIAARKAADDAGPPPSVDSAVSDGAELDPEALTDEAPIDEAPTGELAGEVLSGEAPSGELPVEELAVEELAACETEDLEAEAPGPFSRPANGGEPIGSAREAILRRLGAVQNQSPGLAIVEAPAVCSAEAGPGPFSRPAQTPPAAVQPEGQSEGQATGQVNPAPAASLETDEALRSALATLQRMSVRA